MSHSKFGPSSAHKWMLCPASIALSSGLPKTTSPNAEEGSLAHALAEKCLREGLSAIGPDRLKIVDKMPISIEMAEFVHLYVSKCEELSENATSTWVEEKVDLSGVLNIPGEVGTVDFAALTPDRVLTVVDLKYGFNPVEAENNSQAMLYALGMLPLATMLGDVETIRIVIHQPRVSAEPSVWSLSVAELLAFGERARVCAEYANLLCEDVSVIEGEDIIPGVKQCKYCEAGKQGKCEKVFTTAIRATVEDFENLEDTQLAQKIQNTVGTIQAVDPTTQVFLLSEERFQSIYAHVGLLEDLCKVIRNRAYNELMNADGPRFGCKLVSGKRGSRSWDNAIAAETMMKSFRLKTQDMYNLKLISPTQAEKVLMKDHPKQWHKLASIVTQSAGAPTVVPETDPRPRWVRPEVIEFEDISGEGKEKPKPLSL